MHRCTQRVGWLLGGAEEEAMRPRRRDRSLGPVLPAQTWLPSAQEEPDQPSPGIHQPTRGPGHGTVPVPVPTPGCRVGPLPRSAAPLHPPQRFSYLSLLIQESSTAEQWLAESGVTNNIHWSILVPVWASAPASTCCWHPLSLQTPKAPKSRTKHFPGAEESHSSVLQSL